MKRVLVTFFVTFGMAKAEDAARQLARILTDKGVLTNEELVIIERAGADDAVRMLSSALYRKGILTQSEMARVSSPVTGTSDDVRFLPAVAATVTAAAVPSVSASADHATQAPGTTTAGTAGTPRSPPGLTSRFKSTGTIL